MNNSGPQAVIDLGTHSVLLLIAEIEQNGNLKIIKEDFRVTRLGEGIEQKNDLLPQNQERALGHLRQYQQEIRKAHCSQVSVLATEALRQAPNAPAFLQAIEQEFGWKVTVLTPKEEARYAYLGAISVFDDYESKPFTVVDVGGGSTEITRGLGATIERSQSFPVGVLRLGEYLHSREKISSRDIPAIQQWLDARLTEEVLKNLTKDTILVGTGGTITTAAAIHDQMDKYDPERINGVSLTLDQLLMMFEDLNAKNLEERRAIKGLEAGREEVIIYGLIIFIHLLQRSAIWRIKISARGLRHGYLLAQHQEAVNA